MTTWTRILSLPRHPSALRHAGLTALASVAASLVCAETPSELADPTIDTIRSRYDYFASATVPFGMVALNPDTHHGNLWDAGYRYGDTSILDFSHVHNAQTAGIPVMVATGACRGQLGLEAHRSRFRHDREVIRPGYHRVELLDSGILAELTASTRVGFHRYTFPAAPEAHVLFDLGAPLGPVKMGQSGARRVNDREIEGFSVNAPTIRRKRPCAVYFVARFDHPFDDFSGWKADPTRKDARMPATPDADGRIQGPGAGVAVSYRGVTTGQRIQIKVGISFVGVDQARRNLDAEIPGWDFDGVAAEATRRWEEFLGRIEVRGGTRAQRVKFYTDLMHTAIGRRIYSDADGGWADNSGEHPVTRRVPLDSRGLPTRANYDLDCLWGTQWNLNLLWTLAYPEVGNAIAGTMLDYYQAGGVMARGPWGGQDCYVMVGDTATPLLAALACQGKAAFDLETAYAAARKNAFPGGLRDRAGYESGVQSTGGGIAEYVRLGYVPHEIAKRGAGFHRAGAAMTLEYAYQDWCLAHLARLTGHKDDEALFLKRALNYRNVFDSATKWMRPRHEDGSWLEPFSPVTTGPTAPGFVEANSAIYTFYVPHDLPGLIGLMGGSQAFVNRLEESFQRAAPQRFVTPHGKHGNGWIDYENQPSCHMAHLFSHAGAPWLTQYWVRRVKSETFGGVTPHDGYNGDEDQGQMGALGVLMALGLFDVRGGVGERPVFEITSPLFDEAVIRLDTHKGGNRRLVIRAKNNRPENIYIQSVRFNDHPVLDFRIAQADLDRGGVLEVKLGPAPNKAWGTRP